MQRNIISPGTPREAMFLAHPASLSIITAMFLLLTLVLAPTLQDVLTPVNTKCPVRANRAIKAKTLTIYNGHVVGFC